MPGEPCDGHGTALFQRLSVGKAEAPKTWPKQKLQKLGQSRSSKNRTRRVQCCLGRHLLSVATAFWIPFVPSCCQQPYFVDRRSIRGLPAKDLVPTGLQLPTAGQRRLGHTPRLTPSGSRRDKIPLPAGRGGPIGEMGPNDLLVASNPIGIPPGRILPPICPSGCVPKGQPNG